MVETINEAHAQRAAAKAELENTPAPTALTGAAVYAMIDSLGDMGAALSDARPENLSRLYRDLRLELRYEPHERAVLATASPRVVCAVDTSLAHDIDLLAIGTLAFTAATVGLVDFWPTWKAVFADQPPEQVTCAAHYAAADLLISAVPADASMLHLVE